MEYLAYSSLVGIKCATSCGEETLFFGKDDGIGVGGSGESSNPRLLRAR